HTRFPSKKIYWMPNGADVSFYNPQQYDSYWRQSHGFAANDILFLYAGLMGYAQGLEVIIKAAAKLTMHAEVKFILLGSGPVRDHLVKLTNELKVQNVYFFDLVPKSEMPFVLKSVNAGIIPLRRLELFLGAIPSKIFELLAMKKPILLGVDGEAKELFIDKGKCGMFFRPEDSDHLAEQVKAMIADQGQ